MTDEKKYSLRDMVLAQREAFVEGQQFGETWHHGVARGVCNAWHDVSCARHEAGKRYPFPKVTRPRVVADPHDVGQIEYTVIDGRVQSRRRSFIAPRCYWQDCAGLKWTTERLRLWADLVANPTETVDDDGVADTRSVEAP